MDLISLTVDAPPPTRRDPGRCADRSSPNAKPLFRAASRHVAMNPDAFPIASRVAVVIVSSEPFAEPEGYTIATAIEEVLVDAGVLADERLVQTEWHEIRPDMTGYFVSVEPAQP
jgi:hypothetical protein